MSDEKASRESLATLIAETVEYVHRKSYHITYSGEERTTLEFRIDGKTYFIEIREEKS